MLKNVRAAICAVLMAVILCGSLLAGCSVESGTANNEHTESVSVVISEVMSSNSVFWPAPDGNCYDWVELRNLSGSAIDLSNCFITDDERVPRKFQLSGLVLEPHGYAAIYLSGLNGIDINGNLHAGFRISSAGETLILNGPDGEVMSMVTIPASRENISYGYPTDTRGYDDGYCVWFATPTPGKANADDYASNPDNLVYTTNGVVINEFMTDNSFILYDADGDYPDWVELYNPGSTEADMTGYMLSDDALNPGRWTFPEGTTIPAGGYLVVFCSGKDTVDGLGNLHTNFSLGSLDRTLVLSNEQGAMASQAELSDLPENVSCGRPEGVMEWKLFARPTPGAANTTASFELTSSPTADINDGVLISETLSASSGSQEFTTDYIEIYNATTETAELGGYTLAQSPGEVVFTFPDISLGAGKYLLVYCDGTTSVADAADLHAPIKLNVGGESLYLADATGKIVDYFETGKQIYGVSSGRTGSDTSVRRFFTKPTPGSANSSTWYASYAPQPVFSVLGGYTPSGTEVYITVPEGCTVYYTTNGEDPEKGDKLYTEGTAITISGTTVLKAAAFRDGYLRSQTAAATYLVEEPHSIPVVSVSGWGMIDVNAGILVAGMYNNYNKGWVREVHVEYYDESGNLGVEFNAGAAIFGQYSRSLNKKGLHLNISEQYGNSEVTYPFFPDSVSGVSTFRSILLRPSGQDQSRAMMRDEIIPAIIRGRVEADYMEFRACALYVNGQYWGLYYIRERFDEDYLVSKYGFTKGEVNLVKSQSYAQAGEVDSYKALQNFARENDLTVQENYDYMKSQVDFESLCDFWIVESYFTNADTGNIRCYNTADTKWRWMAYDFDWGMTASTYKLDYLYRHCLDPKGHGSQNLFSNAIIRKLLENEEFRELFISRYCYHINTTFDPDRCIAILEEMADVIRDEVPRNAAKWKKPTVSTWESNVEFLRKFFTVKPDMAKEQLMENFDLSESELNRYLRENK